MTPTITKYISTEKLAKYTKLANNDPSKAVELYVKNTEQSSQMYKLLSYFEVFLRNAINEVMQERDSDWILNLYRINNKILNQTLAIKTIKIKTREKYNLFFKEQEKIISNAKNVLINEHKKLTNDYMVSSLTFGFCAKLFTRIYESNL